MKNLLLLVLVLSSTTVFAQTNNSSKFSPRTTEGQTELQQKSAERKAAIDAAKLEAEKATLQHPAQELKQAKELKTESFSMPFDVQENKAKLEIIHLPSQPYPEVDTRTQTDLEAVNKKESLDLKAANEARIQEAKATIASQKEQQIRSREQRNLEAQQKRKAMIDALNQQNAERATETKAQIAANRANVEAVKKENEAKAAAYRASMKDKPKGNK